MSPPRSIYKTDFVPYDWMQNNFSTESDDFCSPDNIDYCVQYISQECCALGYPAIYVNSNACPYAVNCDIVNLINITFDLLGNSRDHVQAKDDLECRNQRLSSDMTILTKKNSQLKDSAEQLDRKYRSALERERQLKEKIDRLQQANKTEKDEVKKLSSQMLQQKVSHQHEARKLESNMTQMKSRLKQVLSDKNPDKKVASLSATSLLSRSSKERGKWKTEATAKSSVEDMYNSLISSYENRCQEMLKDMSDYQNCFEFIETEMLKLIAEHQDGKQQDATETLDDVPLSVIWNGPNKVVELKQRFESILRVIKENCLKHSEEQLEMYGNIVDDLKYKISCLEKLLQECKSTRELVLAGVGDSEEPSGITSPGITSPGIIMQDQEIQTNLVEEHLHKEKLELCATVALIEKEKANLEAQKINILKAVVQQDVPKAEWHENLKAIPSFSVITTKEGLTSVPTAAQLRQCFSAPEQQMRTLSPLWSLGHTEVHKAKSEEVKSSTKNTFASSIDKVQRDTGLASSGLPKWASSSMNSTADLSGRQIVPVTSDSNEDLEISNISSTSEDQNLSLLLAAVKDIESRRSNPSS